MNCLKAGMELTVERLPSGSALKALVGREPVSNELYTELLFTLCYK